MRDGYERREIGLTIGVLAEARVDWWCLRLGVGDWWVRGSEVAGFLERNLIWESLSVKVSRSEDGNKYRGVKE